MPKVLLLILVFTSFHSAFAERKKGLHLTGHSIPPGHWPSYRRDGGLSGFSPLAGGMATAPKQAWSMNLGGPIRNTERVQLIDLNGDQKQDLLRIREDKLIYQALSGQPIWQTARLPRLRLIQIRDFAGDGSRGIFLASSTGVEHHRYMISGKTGKTTLLFTSRNVFGGYQRFGKIFPTVRGEQICAWWSGDPVTSFGGSGMQGRGYLFSFENGLEKPNRRFHAREVGMIYAPLHLFADMDLDGKQDMVMISHEKVWVYDLATGMKRNEATWGTRIRSYWANTAAIQLKKDALPSLLMINPMIPGVQVIDQSGKKFVRRWKQVVGAAENQYQSKVRVDRGATDPFVDLDGDGNIEILVAVTNEHSDEKTHLVIFRADDGRRVFDAADYQVVTVDELDGQAPPEIIIKSHGRLRICNWNGKQFVDRWVAPANVITNFLQEPAPLEGRLSRAVGARSSGMNMPLLRDKRDKRLFVMQGTGTARVVGMLSGNDVRLSIRAPRPSAKEANHRWSGRKLQIRSNSRWRTTYVMPQRPFYLAAPPLFGKLGSTSRIIVRNYRGAILSLSPQGQQPMTLVRDNPDFTGATLVDVNGDGNNELLALARLDPKTVAVVAVNAAGKRVLTIRAPQDTTETMLGATGRTKRKGRWIIVRYRIRFNNTRVVAYDGTTGNQLWMRDFLGPRRQPSTTFVLHLPTGVHDFDGDGDDDLIASSENWYEVIDVAQNRSLTANRVITAVVPGHWGAYATPMVVDLFNQGKPLVFHNNAYALNLLTRPNGSPVWHYALTRDTTHPTKAGVADLDGDGLVELVTTQQDGLLRAFNAKPAAHKCPSCPPSQALTAHNHSGVIRWTHRLPARPTDLVTIDLDGDKKTELLCGAGSRLFALAENNRRLQVKWQVRMPANAGAPIVADLNGDGRAEILLTTADGKLRCLTNTTK